MEYNQLTQHHGPSRLNSVDMEQQLHGAIIKVVNVTARYLFT